MNELRNSILSAFRAYRELGEDALGDVVERLLQEHKPKRQPLSYAARSGVWAALWTVVGLTLLVCCFAGGSLLQDSRGLHFFIGECLLWTGLVGAIIYIAVGVGYLTYRDTR